MFSQFLSLLCAVGIQALSEGDKNVCQNRGKQLKGQLKGDLQQQPGRGAGHPACGDPVGAGVGPEAPRHPFQP